MEHKMSNVEENIIIVQEKLKNLRELGIEDSFDLEMDIMNNMPDFYEKFPALVKRLCREPNQDNTYLYKMLSLLKEVEKGNKSLSTIELELGNELAEKFVYPVIKNLENPK